MKCKNKGGLNKITSTKTIKTLSFRYYNTT